MNDIKQEIKFTPNCIYLKMNNTYELNNIKLNIRQFKRIKPIKSLIVFVSNSEKDILELKN